LNRYDCPKCGKIWFSAADPRGLKQKYCVCGMKLEFSGGGKGAEMADDQIPPVEVSPGAKKGAKGV
jgi:hypothetical protein